MAYEVLCEECRRQERWKQLNLYLRLALLGMAGTLLFVAAYMSSVH
jgi:hypothetical protein